MRLDRPYRSLLPLIFGFFLLSLTVLGTLWLVDRQERSFGAVRHTLEVQNRLSMILSRLQDAETGQRGYMLTGRTEYLEPYAKALSGLGTEFVALSEAVADNPRQLTRVKALKRLSDQRQDLIRLTLERFRSGETGSAIELVREGSGKRLMDRLRDVIEEMRAEEQRLLASREAMAQRQALLVKLGLLASGGAIILLALFAIHDARKRLAQALAAAVDLGETNEKLKKEIGERQAVEGQVRQMQKMESIGHLTGGIAHDFNNMLAIVIGSLDLAQRRFETDPDKAKACIDNASEGAHRAAQLTARLLAFSRQQPLEPRPVDANKLVGGMSELLRRTLGEHISVETVLAGGLWPTYIDAGQLENAILNLCVNARDAMPDGGKLTIETNNTHLDERYAAEHEEVTPGQYVVLCVTDTGTGMPPHVIERAFDPFYTTKGVGRGTGLGLSQVFGFVKQSGGHIKIYSEPDHGTTVKLYLPRHFGSVSIPASTDAPGHPVPHAQDGEIILVVEDEERVRHMSVDALRSLGYTVVQASDGEQALAVLAIQPRVDLLFTDIVMPGMNGRQLADAAREQRPDLKVLFTTGYTRNAVVHNGVLDPGVAFISKPFGVDQLALKVRQVLDGMGDNRAA
ncbi:CHASE3 domain-containing protein [Sphingomonas sp. IC-11]|uniref:CHASE3 domain-containing protein n=1 Tax=Sphingomonas sp. IC-11 TaxID=2898528 RepID=UPI001E5C19D3|nr:CHASE3 domain-containing protein [Sphingomonas sp. IC-11]MCD2317586.1 CHASE3 domain-containing protein [Sphingomonas sp. IC-11]